MAKGAEGSPCVDVTPHNRSKCQSKACKETLKKGEIRVGNSSKKNWWHIKCVPEKQKSKVESVEDLQGFSELGATEQKKLQKEWDNSGAASGSDEEVETKTTGKRKRKNEKEKPKKKKKRDNGGVKRGRSAYIFFSNEKRAEVLKENPEMKAKEIVTELGARWKKLTVDEKQPYLKMQNDDKQRYKDELEAKKKEEKKGDGEEAEAEEEEEEEVEEVEEEEEEEAEDDE